MELLKKMPCELHIQTITRKDGEPRTAVRRDITDDATHREVYQFYFQLKNAVREIEVLLDEEYLE